MRIRFNKKYALWALTPLDIEFLIATVFSRIGFTRSYISDVLVAILSYCLVFSVIKARNKSKLIGGILLFVVLVEVLQYFGVATYSGFTKGSLGYTILGNHFSWGDIPSYAIGCLILQLTTRN